MHRNHLVDFFAANWKRKLMLVVLVLVICIAGAVGQFWVDSQRRELIIHLQQEASRTTKMLAQTLAAPMWNIDLNFIQAEMEAVMEDPQIFSVALYDSRSSQPFMQKSRPGQAVDEIDSRAPILYTRGAEQIDLGQVRLVYTRQYLYRTLNQMRLWIITIVAAMIVTLSISIDLLFQRLVQKPIRQVAEMMNQIADGDFATRLPVTSQDEIGQLAEACNRMAGELQELLDEGERAGDELRRHRDHLEELVAARTAEQAALVQELESFSHSVSHDLRAPLRGIEGYIRLLRADYEQQLDADGQLYLQKIAKSAEQMNQLIEALLGLARLNNRGLKYTQLDLSQMAGTIAAWLHSQNPERAVEFNIQPGLSAFADPALLQNTLENLLGNAWKFTAHSQPARIEFGRVNDGDQAFYVRDNGVGFDMAYAPKLFNAFQRLHRAEDFPGTGLGLASVQRIIQRHGGKVWAESAPGQGATFYFSLPG